jgi:hypothetical protein
MMKESQEEIMPLQSADGYRGRSNNAHTLFPPSFVLPEMFQLAFGAVALALVAVADFGTPTRVW